MMEHPFAALTGLTLISADATGSLCHLTVSPPLLNPHRVLHGAMLYALADTAMGAATYATLGEGERCATIEISMRYFKSVSEGELTCRAAIQHRGKRVVQLQADITKDGVLVAQASGSFYVIVS